MPAASWIIERFPPNRRAAVDSLRKVIDESILREISEANYGYEPEKHFSRLEQIWRGCELGEMDTWYPMEVLELMRWSEPGKEDWKPCSDGIRGHKIRAFSCSVLLATPNFEPEKETLIQLIDSALVLERDIQEATAAFLTSRIEELGREEDRPFFVLALSAMIMELEPNLSEAREADLALWIEEEENSERNYLAEYNSEYQTCRWMFGLSFSDMKNGSWNRLIQRLQRASVNRPLGVLLTSMNRA